MTFSTTRPKWNRFTRVSHNVNFCGIKGFFFCTGTNGCIHTEPPSGHGANDLLIRPDDLLIRQDDLIICPDELVNRLHHVHSGAHFFDFDFTSTMGRSHYLV